MPQIISLREDHLDAAAAGAVIVFNEGRKALCDVFEILGSTVAIFWKTDVRRVKESNKSASEIQKKIRKGRRNIRKLMEDKNVQKEGVTYAPGGF